MWYIMKGYHYDAKKVSIADIIKEERGNFSIIICQRESGYDKMTPTFLISHGNEMDEELGATRYTQDTGNGYKRRGWLLRIENIIYVDKDGVITHTVNDIGLDVDEERTPWVCK